MNLYVSNISFGFSIMSLCDVMAQKIENKKNIDFNRTLKIASTTGLLNGIFLTKWYLVLNKYIPKTTNFFIIKRILADELIYANFSINSYLMINNNFIYDKYKNDFKNKYLDIYKSDLMIWPISNCINFYYIPLKYQVVFSNCTEFFWSTYLSHKLNQ